MVEGALRIELCGQTHVVQLLGDLLGQLRCAGGRILHCIQLGWKAAEVVPGLRVFARRQQQALAFPMRRHHHYGVGSGYIGGQFGQRRAAGTGLQGQHGGTVGNEQAGQHDDLQKCAHIFSEVFID